MEKEQMLQEEAPIKEGYEKQIHDIAIENKRKVFDAFEKGVLFLRNYSGVGLFKSIRRAIRRGHVSMFGDIYPKRPFNNRKNKKLNEDKKGIYGQLKKGRL